MKTFVFLLFFEYARAEIRNSVIMNKLTKVKPVGSPVRHKFMPLTEIPPPSEPKSGRRHYQNDCTERYRGRDVYEAGHVGIFGEDYEEGEAKTVATVIIPDHIDHKHFEVTSQVPYLTVGPIEAIGYHPTTKRGDHPAECEKIYQDHLDEQYSVESMDYSEESLEMARMPLFPMEEPTKSAEARLEAMYSDTR